MNAISEFVVVLSRIKSHSDATMSNEIFETPPNRTVTSHRYGVSFRYRHAGSEGDSRPKGGTTELYPPDLERTADPLLEPDEYGRALTKSLFADTDVRDSFLEAITAARYTMTFLRIRLELYEAPELEAIHWELLRDPRSDEAIFADALLMLSRYPVSDELLKVVLPVKRDLRALVMIASPKNLDPKRFARIDVTNELRSVQESLGELSNRIDVLPNDVEHATFRRLNEWLQKGHFHILYLLCHGTTFLDEHALALEGEGGDVEFVTAGELEAVFRRLGAQRPLLVILAACMTTRADTIHASIGPRLAKAGVPAVIAMQSAIGLQTNNMLMGEFFKQLLTEGIVDRALAAARWEIRRQIDFWVPVLYLRLTSGALWLDATSTAEHRELPDESDSFSAPLDWTNPDLVKLNQLLSQAYPSLSSIGQMAALAGIAPGTFPQTSIPTNSLEIWSEVMNVLAKQGRLRNLFEVAARDPAISAYHATLNDLRVHLGA